MFKKELCLLLMGLTTGCATTCTTSDKNPDTASTIEVLRGGCLEQGLEEKRHILAALESQADTLSIGLENAQNELDTFNNELIGAVEQQIITTSEADQLTQEVQEKSHQLTSTRTRLVSLKQKLQTLKSTRAEMAKPTNTGEIYQAQAEIKRLQEETAKLKIAVEKTLAMKEKLAHN